MLAGLSIRDVVLIDRLDLDFAPGLSALTGETGAGKSILLDALGLGLGGRAEARLVRQGAAQASVTARFELPAGHAALCLLAEQEIAPADDGDLVLRRILGSDGRSRAFVNDQPVSVALLRRLGEMLVEVHGQFESQRLLEPACHRDLVDAFGGLQQTAAATADAWQSWRAAIEARATAAAKLASARRDEDYLRHALDELRKLAPRAGEETELAERRALLQNAEKLITAIGDAAGSLKRGRDGESCAEALRAALRQLSRMLDKAGGRLEPVVVALERALNEIMEAEALLERLQHDSDLDPAQLEKVEERLFALRAAARKHDVAPEDLPDFEIALAERLAAVDDGADTLARLEREEHAAAAAYRAVAERLSAARRDAASRLDRRVAVELEPLRLGKATFVTRIDTLAEADWGPGGMDRVHFEVATNPGTASGPLARIASGGELSRFMLALKVALADADPVPTLVFDEVDAGIGGAVAAAVGERLARLAGDVQVLVVTHSPQVAARGHHHWRIAKALLDDGARTAVEVLDAAARREEIARMLAGARVTDEARAAADSLLHGLTA